MTSSDVPFTTIESAHEFLALLGESIDEALNEVRNELERCAGAQQDRRREAWQVVFYTPSKVATNVAASGRLMNDLRTLRTLMHRHGAEAGGPAAATPTAGPMARQVLSPAAGVSLSAGT